MGKLSTDAQALIRRFAEKFPVPVSEDDCRTWVHRLAEQFRFAYGPGWGHKRADPYRPLSSDVMAYQEAAVFVGYDVILNAGTPDRRLVTDGDSLDLTGQVFVPVEPVDHLGGTVPVPTPEPTPTPEPCACRFAATDLSAVLARLEALEVRQAAVEASLDDMDAPIVAALTRPWPSYTGKILGFKVVLRPEG